MGVLYINNRRHDVLGTFIEVAENGHRTMMVAAVPSDARCGDVPLAVRVPVAWFESKNMTHAVMWDGARLSKHYSDHFYYGPRCSSCEDDKGIGYCRCDIAANH